MIKALRRISRVALRAVALVALGLCACQERPTSDSVPPAAPPVAAPPTIAPPLEPASVETPPISPAPEALCPERMAPIPGGSFWVGSLTKTYQDEENPRFRTTVRGFCAERSEVTAADYETCVKKGRCQAPSEQAMSKRCTYGKPGKENHPINCVSFPEAEAYCSAQDARLPTEIEWEYLARGGAQMLTYPWGDAEPDGRTCWKASETCAIGAFGAGAFGLRDVTGNVWEWTSSWFGRYPWPQKDGRHRVYRGGSWSRRFDKWLKPTLRNRSDPAERGSHLGFRCVADRATEPCPYGKDSAGQCLFGIDEVACDAGTAWNGLRCAAPGAPGCEAGTVEEKGYGCVRVAESRSRAKGAPGANEENLTAVIRARSPSFDADCEKNQPTRPHAYRYSGGEHAARNRVGKQDGCKNRDVGVGWNSACCP